MDIAVECPVCPGYFFKRNGTFSVGTAEGPFFKGYRCKLSGLYYRRLKTIQGSSRMIHRMVAYTFCHNPLPDLFNIVDHIDGNTMHNEESNLRWVNALLNVANSSARNTYLSVRRPIKVKGKQIWVQVEPRWESRITMQGQCYKLGYYTTEAEACVVSRMFRALKWEEIYMEYLKENGVGREEAASFDIQHVRPPTVVSGPSVPGPTVEWVGEDRSPRMCFCNSHTKVYSVPKTKKKELTKIK